MSWTRNRRIELTPMNQTVVALEVGEYGEVEWMGFGFNVDTIIGTSVAAVVVLALAFFLKAKVTSTDAPSGVQLFFEAITIQMRQQIESAIGMRIAPFVLPLSVAIFVFILVSNWISVFPWQYATADGAVKELIKPPAADINYVLALAAFVFICYHAAGFWRRGLLGHPWKVLKGHVTFLMPINIVEEIAKPLSLSLRLFGNIFAGGILVGLIALLGANFGPAAMAVPNAIWKTFDLFVGLIQAFIFSLLTILYFSQAMEMEEDHH